MANLTITEALKESAIYGKSYADNTKYSKIYKPTSEGHITDSDEGVVKDILMTSPDTEQNNTKGYQLLDLSDVAINRLKNVSYTNSYSFNYTDLSTPFEIKNGEDYTISFLIKSSTGSIINKFTLCEQYTSKLTYTFYKTVGQDGIRLTGKATATSDAVINIIGFQTASANSEFSIEDIMLEKGSTAHGFEPYTNGASPNPSCPQPIVSTEKVRVNVFGVGSIGSELSQAQWNWLKDNYDIWHKSTNRVYLCTKATDGRVGQVIACNSNSYSYGDGYAISVGGTVTRTNYDVTKNYYNNYTTYGSAIYNESVHSEDTVGIPSKQNIFITLPKPLNKIGDVADEIDVETGVYRYKCGSADLGDLTWTRYKQGNYYIFYAAKKDMKKHISVKNVNIICEAYTVSKDSYADMAIDKTITEYTANASDTTPYIYIRDDDFANATDFKNSVKEVSCVYELATPQELPIDPADLELLRSLKTYAGTTNISITDNNGRDVGFALRYAQTIESVIEEHAPKSEVSYSTSEQLIGTWVDGSPLYSRTFAFQNGGTSGIFDSAFKSSLYTIRNVKGSALYTTGNVIPFPSMYMTVIHNENGLLWEAGASINGAGENYVTVEYTKRSVAKAMVMSVDDYDEGTTE